MNKRVITLSVVGLLALSATGCSSAVSPLEINGESVIVTIGEGDNQEHYTANELFDNYLSTASGTTAAFSALYDVLVRKAVPVTQEMTNEITSLIARFQQNASTAAATNGTTYNEELSNALESEGVDDIEELSKKYELERQKTKFENDYYDSQLYSRTMSQDVDNDEDPTKPFSKYYLTKEYIENENPYHVRHILVRTSSSGDSFLPGSETISEAEAKKLANTIKNLASPSSTFGQVAADFSDDGSATELGNLTSLMGRSTGYVNEFKFAIFQYDAYHNYDVQGNGAEALNIPETVKIGDEATLDTRSVLDNSIGYIPYSVADQLLTYADTTRLPDGENYKDGKEIYYPRNILFNQYFANHGLSFIVRGANGPRNGHFLNIEGISRAPTAEEDVLCDENGRPLLVTRAGTGSGDSGYQGVHFILVENSPLVNETKVSETDYTYSVDEEMKYYSINVPKADDNVANDRRYVTFVSTSRADYSTRAGEIEESIKGYDSNSNFRLYEKVLSDLNDLGYTVTIDDRIAETISTYITVTRARSALSKEETYLDSWTSYVRLLQTQRDFSGYKIALSEINNFDSAYSDAQ